MSLLGAFAVPLLVASLVTCEPAASGAVSGHHPRETLDAPSQLLVGHENHTSVLLTWEFAPMESLGLGNVTFGISLSRETEIVKSYEFRPGAMPFRFQLSDLKPFSPYTVGIYAHCEPYENSTLLTKKFHTMVDDWPSPEIVDTSAEDRFVRVDYTVSWRILSSRRDPSFFEVKSCRDDDICEFVRVPPTKTSITLSLMLYYAHTVTVAVVYEEPVVGTIRRRSKEIAAVSPLLRPSQIFTRSEEQLYCENIVDFEDPSCRNIEGEGFREILRRPELPSIYEQFAGSRGFSETRWEWEEMAWVHRVLFVLALFVLVGTITGIGLFFIWAFNEFRKIIRRLPPGYFLRWDGNTANGGAANIQMEEIPPAPQPPPMDPAPQNPIAPLRRSRRLRGDVPADV